MTLSLDYIDSVKQWYYDTSTTRDKNLDKCEWTSGYLGNNGRARDQDPSDVLRTTTGVRSARGSRLPHVLQASEENVSLLSDQHGSP